MSKLMTLEQVRNWHRRFAETHKEDDAPEFHARCADAIDAHLAHTRKPDAWAWRSDGMTGWALGHVKPTPENTHDFHKRNTVVRGLYFGSDV